jgi:hypothetical protein
MTDPRTALAEALERNTQQSAEWWGLVLDEIEAAGYTIVASDRLAGLEDVEREARAYHDAASGGHLPWISHTALGTALSRSEATEKGAG